ncbi:MAG: hypothetical protein NWS00_06015 [Opitutales bacterium]|nr:hypothetical protein [Opitutales bacterium]
MKTGTVGYHFELADREVSFEVGTQARDIQNDGDHPEWALLKNKQCACCPLKEADCAY